MCEVECVSVTDEVVDPETPTETDASAVTVAVTLTLPEKDALGVWLREEIELRDAAGELVELGVCADEGDEVAVTAAVRDAAGDTVERPDDETLPEARPLRETVTVVVGDADVPVLDDGEPEYDTEPVPVTVPVAHTDADVDFAAEADAAPDPLTDNEAVTVTVDETTLETVGSTLIVGVIVVDALVVEQPEVFPVADELAVRADEPDDVTDVLVVGHGEFVAETSGDLLREETPLALRVPDAHADTDTLELTETVGARVAETSGETEDEMVADADPVARTTVGDIVGDETGLLDGVESTLPVTEDDGDLKPDVDAAGDNDTAATLGDGNGETVPLIDALGDTVTLAVTELDAVPDADMEDEPVADIDARGDALPVTKPVAFTLNDPTAEIVGVARADDDTDEVDFKLGDERAVSEIDEFTEADKTPEPLEAALGDRCADSVVQPEAVIDADAGADALRVTEAQPDALSVCDLRALALAAALAVGCALVVAFAVAVL